MATGVTGNWILEAFVTWFGEIGIGIFGVGNEDNNGDEIEFGIDIADVIWLLRLFVLVSKEIGGFWGPFCGFRFNLEISMTSEDRLSVSVRKSNNGCFGTGRWGMLVVDGWLDILLVNIGESKPWFMSLSRNDWICL